ncbi:hypothetical protein FRC10_005946 [Ceratobasidium sp. 414]|nr:hypothetical protein FRC10_005946 [Ceratobasidium sp. 414]
MNVASINFKPLLSVATRANALASLPPLPIPLVSSPNPAYPSVQVLGQTLSLPLLPRPTQPPPLPARPGTAGSPQQPRAPNPPAPSAASRLNPFASLFGSSRNTPAPTPPPLANVTPAPLAPPNDTGSARSSIDLSTSEGPIIAAYTIDRRISRPAIAKEATRAIKGEIKAALNVSGVPGWVKDRVTAFVNPLLPVPKATRHLSGGENQTPRPDMSSPQAASDSVQHFLSLMEDELFTYFGAGNSANGRRKDDPGVDEKAAATAKREDTEEKERKMRGVMEKVERVVCSLFYERFFRPSTSDDASHDDALSSQVASLNMLDLCLGHLGVDVPSGAEKGVDSVIKQCGREGLSRLPPLRLKSENEMAEEKTPTASTFKEPSATTSPQPTPEIVMSPDSDPAGLPPPEASGPVLDPLSAPGSPAHSMRQLLHGQHSKNTSPALTPGPALPADGEIASPSPAPSIVIQPTAVSSDVLLPVMIYAVVKANPNQLVSHLLYVQRFRSRSVGGEESFCLINLLAVVEFLENVDLAVLGLASSEKVMRYVLRIMSWQPLLTVTFSVAELTPIPLAETVESAASASSHPLDIIAASIKLRGKVNQVGEMAGSAAGKVLLGVMDTSMLALKGLLSGTETNPDDSNQRPGFGLLRRGSGFSIASVAASLPSVGRGTPRSAPVDEIPQEGQQLIEVSSRPGSLKDERMGDSDDSSGSSGSANGSSDEDGSSDDQEASGDEGARGGDARSVRSFSSMLSRGSRDERRDRPSLQDRLANMSTLSRYSKSPPGGGLRKPSPPPAKRTSLLVANPFAPPALAEPEAQAPPSVPHLQIPPPNPRFLECAVEDLRLSEVAELLADYKRVVAGMQALDGFANP